MERVQVQGLRGRPQLQAAPLPSDTFRGAPNVESGAGRLADLADALGSFNGSLNSLNQKRKAQNPSKEEVQRQLNLVRQAEQDEIDFIKKNGTFSNGEPLINGQVKKLVGRTEGLRLKRNIMAELGETNLVGVDVNGLIDERLAQVRSEFGEDVFITGGFLEVEEDIRRSALDAQTNQHVAADREFKDIATTQYLFAEADNIVSQGGTVDDVNNFVRNLARDITGPGGTISRAEFDERLFSLADRYAEAQPEVAKALLQFERTDHTNGQLVGSLLTKDKGVGRARSIIQRADAELLKRDTAAKKEQVNVDNIRRVVEKRDFASLEDVEINGKVFTKEEQEARFTKNVNDLFDQKVRTGELSVNHAVREKVRIFSFSNIDFNFIGDELGGIARRVSPSSLGEPEFLADVSRRFELFQQLKATHKNFVLDQVPEVDRKFYRIADALQRYKDLPVQSALNSAARIINSEDGPENANLNKYRDQITTSVRGQFSSWLGLSNDLNKEFQGNLVNEVTNFAQILVAEGFEPQTAIRAASEQVTDDLVIYKGVALLGLEGVKDIPKDNLTEALDVSLENALKGLPEGVEIEGEARVKHIGGGLLWVFDEDGVPVINPETGREVHISAQTVLRNSRKLKTDAVEAENKETSQNIDNEELARRKERLNELRREDHQRRNEARRRGDLETADDPTISDDLLEAQRSIEEQEKKLGLSKSQRRKQRRRSPIGTGIRPSQPIGPR